MIVPLKYKLGLGILAGYSTYTVYVSVRRNLEISRREKKFKKSTLEDEETAATDHRYKVMKIGGRFENPFPEYRAQTLYEFFFTRILEVFEGRSRGRLPETEQLLRELLPVERPFFELLQNNLNQKETHCELKLPELANRLTFTWLGQSCSFFQIGHVSFLTDPIFQDYLVNKSIGPKRITPSPCQLDELPVPDFTLVSHNHPDHLEEESIKNLGNKTTWIVPLGLRKFLAREGIYNIIELEWWERVPLEVPNSSDKFEVVCLPLMHWSGRKIIDSNSSLWCSFLILRNNKSIFYHAGDTGYSKELFKSIHDNYGDVLFSMLPIGQYCPQWHQRPRHINPEEALQIMQDLHSKHMVGVHWGTFVLSSEYFLEPKLLLEKLAVDLNLSNVKAPQFGQTECIDINEI